jgi:hypothetical protein
MAYDGWSLQCVLFLKSASGQIAQLGTDGLILDNDTGLIMIMERQCRTNIHSGLKVKVTTRCTKHLFSIGIPVF